jgi:hypothetical protein
MPFHTFFTLSTSQDAGVKISFRLNTWMFSEKKLILDLATQSQETFKILGGD